MKKSIFIILLLNAMFGFSQHDVKPQEDDVKVGLVLSGGGAKGFAHIGVLKVLEEAGIRIDYIAGTSMGAMVGSLYASGYNAHELDSLVEKYDFQYLLQDKTPRNTYSFYQKSNTEKYVFSLPIKDWKVGLPSAISNGQNVFNLFSQLTRHVHDIEDFSKLPIPFFCVATNLESGTEEILDHGFLPEAVRASGSFPGLLSPVTIDGKILVDGGIVDNFPVDLLKKKGVDYIIGVDVQGKLEKRKELNSVPNIIMQIAGFQMYQNTDLKVEMTDVYIKPDITDFNDFSFDKKMAIIDEGENVARQQYDKIKSIAEMQNKGRFHNTINTFSFIDETIIKEIVIVGNENYTKDYCLHKLNIKTDKVLNQDKFIEGVDRLTATGNFSSVLYRFEPVEGGAKVIFTLVENEIATYLKLGIHFDDLYKTGVLINITRKHLLSKNDFLSTDFVVGDNLRYNIDYFIDKGLNWSFGINSRSNSFDEDIYVNALPFDDNTSQLKVPLTYTDYKTELFVQKSFKNKMALRLGVADQYLKVYANEIVNDEKQKKYFEKGNYLNAFAKATYDSYDSKYFPKKGFYFDSNYIFYAIETNEIYDFSSFSQLYGTIGYAYTFYDKLTLHLLSQAGVTFGSNPNSIHDFHLGGNNENFINTFFPFYGYDVGELNSNGFVKTGLTVRYEIFKKNYLSFTGNYARAEDDLWNAGSIFDNTKSGYAVGYSFDSFLGPLELKYSWTPDSNTDIWYFNLGFWF